MTWSDVSNTAHQPCSGPKMYLFTRCTSNSRINTALDSGRALVFFSGVCVRHPKSPGGVYVLVKGEHHASGATLKPLQVGMSGVCVWTERLCGSHSVCAIKLE